MEQSTYSKVLGSVPHLRVSKKNKQCETPKTHIALLYDVLEILLTEKRSWVLPANCIIKFEVNIVAASFKLGNVADMYTSQC